MVPGADEAAADRRLCNAPRAPVAVSRRLRPLCLAGILVLLLGLGYVGHRSARAETPDFEYFYKAGAWLLHHGALDPGYDLIDGRPVERGGLDWYLPFVSRALTPFALLADQGHAGYAWLALNLAALAATLYLAGRHLLGCPRENPACIQFLSLALVAAYWYWEFRLNQINNFTLLLLVASFAAWQMKRPASSGFLLGVAVLLKLTPALLALWFLLKREYRAFTAAVLTVLVAGPLADALILGPADARTAYRAWARNALEHGSSAALVREQCEMDWRNQSLAAVASRWLHPTNYVTQFDNDPRVDARYGEEGAARLNVASLPLPVIARGVTLAHATILLLLVWITRHPASRLDAATLRMEWALFLLAMLGLMPVMRLYHMIWAYPAVALLVAGLPAADRHAPRAWLTIACVALASAAPLTLLHRPFMAAGATLLATALLALPLVLRLARPPTTGAPQPAALAPGAPFPTGPDPASAHG